MHEPAYGHWGLVFVNVAFLMAFAASFVRLPRSRDWRALGPFAAFVTALFVEMYGFPLTIYLLSGWIARFVPGFDAASHDAGHLWFSLLGHSGNPHAHPIHLLANVAILAGILVVASAWRVLFEAQVAGTLATTGAYRLVRHPQYGGFLLVMGGYLVMWPTLPTLLMFPILALVYARLAVREERDMDEKFGEAWRLYAQVTPRFLPKLRMPGAFRTPPTGI
jgi:protein-S-isoprenylcysteine O-methyltransferase Ste14